MSEKSVSEIIIGPLYRRNVESTPELLDSLGQYYQVLLALSLNKPCLRYESASLRVSSLVIVKWKSDLIAEKYSIVQLGKKLIKHFLIPFGLKGFPSLRRLCLLSFLLRSFDNHCRSLICLHFSTLFRGGGLVNLRLCLWVLSVVWYFEHMELFQYPSVNLLLQLLKRLCI